MPSMTRLDGSTLLHPSGCQADMPVNGCLMTCGPPDRPATPSSRGAACPTAGWPPSPATRLWLATAAGRGAALLPGRVLVPALFPPATLASGLATPSRRRRHPLSGPRLGGGWRAPPAAARRARRRPCSSNFARQSLRGGRRPAVGVRGSPCGVGTRGGRFGQIRVPPGPLWGAVTERGATGPAQRGGYFP